MLGIWDQNIGRTNVSGPRLSHNKSFMFDLASARLDNIHFQVHGSSAARIPLKTYSAPVPILHLALMTIRFRSTLPENKKLQVGSTVASVPSKP